MARPALTVLLTAALLASLSCATVPRAGYPAVPALEVEWTPLAGGIDSSAFRIAEPRLRLHALRVDLAAEGVSVVVTPSSGKESTVMSRKTTTFLAEFGCAVAVNANPFDPASEREGQELRVVGLAVSDGAPVAPPDSRYAALVFGRDGRASVVAQAEVRGDADIRNAVGGFFVVLKDGLPTGDGQRRHPRTAAGTDATGRFLYLMAVDGRSPGSAGTTELETGELLARLGAVDGLILDGGGSSAMALRTEAGRARLANVPVDGGIPGRERAVANHLGIRAPPL